MRVRQTALLCALRLLILAYLDEATIAYGHCVTTWGHHLGGSTIDGNLAEIFIHPQVQSE
jgi:hypothetical protein